MPVISCSCGKSYQLQEGLGGKSFRCKECNAKLTVPPDGAAQPAKVAQPAERLRPEEVDKSLIGAFGTVAGNPGLLPFSTLQFYRTHGWMVPAFAVVAVASAVFLYFKIHSDNALTIALVAAPFLFVVFALSLAEQNKRKFRTGNLCPAIVVDVAPYTVAVFTDLSNNRSGPKPAIRICRAPLSNMFGGAPKRGDRLAAVSLYFGKPGTGHWDDFHPEIINTASANRAHIDRALASFDAEDWVLLDRLTPKLKTRGVGIYRLWQMPDLLAGG